MTIKVIIVRFRQSDQFIVVLKFCENRKERRDWQD